MQELEELQDQFKDFLIDFRLNNQGKKGFWATFATPESLKLLEEHGDMVFVDGTFSMFKMDKLQVRST